MTLSYSYEVLSFLASFKAIIIEGTEIVIIAFSSIPTLGKKNVLLGVMLGIAISAVIFLALENIFKLFNTDLVSIVAGIILLYFAQRFGKGFYKYYVKKRSFTDKMDKEVKELIEKTLEGNRINILPILMATLVEGSEATLIIAASGIYSPTTALFGALTGVMVLLVIAYISYRLLTKIKRWMIDLIGLVVLATFGTLFLVTGLLHFFTV